MTGSFAPTAAAAGAPVAGAASPRRFLKQGRQYTGRPGVGRNGAHGVVALSARRRAGASRRRLKRHTGTDSLSKRGETGG